MTTERKERRNELLEQVFSLVRANADILEPHDEEQNSEEGPSENAPFLFNSAIVVLSYLDKDNDEWLTVWRPSNMTQSQMEGMLHRGLYL